MCLTKVSLPTFNFKVHLFFHVPRLSRCRSRSHRNLRPILHRCRIRPPTVQYGCTGRTGQRGEEICTKTANLLCPLSRPPPPLFLSLSRMGVLRSCISVLRLQALVAMFYSAGLMRLGTLRGSSSLMQGAFMKALSWVRQRQVPLIMCTDSRKSHETRNNSSVPAVGRALTAFCWLDPACIDFHPPTIFCSPDHNFAI